MAGRPLVVLSDESDTELNESDTELDLSKHDFPAMVDPEDGGWEAPRA